MNPRFSLIFVSSLAILLSISSTLKLIVPDNLIHFTIIHLLAAPLFIKRNGYKEICWYVLTFMHGVSHITHPAFHGTVVNENFNPLYDYIIHAAQCLCVFYYHKNLFPVGVFLHSMMLIGATISHLDETFLQTYLWILISFGGVFGTQYHMMLLNKNKDVNIFIESAIIWTLPYIGYLYQPTIPQWDNFANQTGLFKLWMLNFGLTYTLHQFLQKMIPSSTFRKLHGEDV